MVGRGPGLQFSIQPVLTHPSLLMSPRPIISALRWLLRRCWWLPVWPSQSTSFWRADGLMRRLAVFAVLVLLAFALVPLTGGLLLILHFWTRG